MHRRDGDTDFHANADANGNPYQHTHGLPIPKPDAKFYPHVFAVTDGHANALGWLVPVAHWDQRDNVLVG